MSPLILFILLGLIEFGVIYFYWSKVSDFYDMGKDVGTMAVKATPMKYKRLPLKFVAMVKSYKKLLWLPVITLVLINLVISVILGGLIELIMLIF